jgi:F-type H+-transporting ATPase subunit a
MIGSYALDMSPTKHVVMMILASILACIVLIGAAQRSRSATPPKAERLADWPGRSGDGALYPERSHLAERRTARTAVVPYLLSVFFFILFANLGLLPYGSTATGNISVTATLAIIAFIVIEIAGMRALGKGYINTIIYFPPKDMPAALKPVLFAIMTPVEILGKFTKPFALHPSVREHDCRARHGARAHLDHLHVRLDPDRYRPCRDGGGHHGTRAVRRTLQAYVFTLLVSSFIGQIRTVEGH